jgi:hypothetical protein
MKTTSVTRKPSTISLPVIASSEGIRRSLSRGKRQKQRLCVRGGKYIAYFDE